MGIGFIVTIVLLAVVLGLFSKQALSSEQGKSRSDVATEPSITEAIVDKPMHEAHANSTESDHPHAM